MSWTDSTGLMWLFSGVGEDSNGNGSSLSDFWSYDPSTGRWIWQRGSTTGNVTGVYGTLGVAAASNAPGARFYSASWTDGSDQLWMFGGYAYGSTGGQSNINDLWVYR